MNNTGMPNSTLNWSTPQASAILEIKLHSYFQRLQIPSTLQAVLSIGHRLEQIMSGLEQIMSGHPDIVQRTIIPTKSIKYHKHDGKFKLQIFLSFISRYIALFVIII